MTTPKLPPEFAEFLAWESISRDTIDVKTIYIDIAGGDHAAGIFLSQLIYWYMIPGRDGRTKLRVRRNGHLWVAKARDEWYDEIRLRPRQFDRVAKLLCDLGLIEKEVFKFAGTPKTHVRIIIDQFLAAWRAEAGISDEEEPDDAGDTRGVKSTSPNREVHIQRPLISSSKEEEEKEYCDVCEKRDKYAERLSSDIDPKQRCAWCFVLDGWAHTMGVRVPRRLNTDMSKELRKKARTRMSEKGFRNSWLFSLEKASRMQHLKNGGWFTLGRFLGNDHNYEEVIDVGGGEGKWDWLEKKNHPHSYAQLQAWLSARKAGKTGSSTSQAGYSPFQAGQG